MKHEEIKKYTTIWMDTVRDGQFGLANTNKLVRFYDGTTGLKTGFTSAAGYCLSASAERGGMELIAVVMHCDTSAHRFESAKAMLNYGFSNYALPVTLGASMCFASPFSTPPNALVMQAGQYTFADYIKVGLPLQIILGIIMSLLLPIIYPL